eukprot:c1030_g1_i1.p2 GENE.c1030_g1_i1~~c1030_g1_i1.p2  ORF type:complete len:211 (-),score=46.85 c1030_g1_i1:46-678(-)
MDLFQLSALHGKANRIYCQPRFLTHAEVAVVLASADVHVSHSLFDTLGNTVLEAHASGTPVIMPRACGFVDTVAHEVDGYLFQNESEAIQCLNNISQNRELARQMGQAGMHKVTTNNEMSKVGDDLEGWYWQAMCKPPKLLPRRIMSAIKTSVFVGALLFVFVTNFLCESALRFAKQLRGLSAGWLVALCFCLGMMGRVLLDAALFNQVI